MIEHAVLKTITAFLNTDGGALLVGVSDDGIISGIEKDGFQIFGGEPFLNQVAAESPEDYFMEAVAAYMVNPTVLYTVDLSMYEWVGNEVFGGREYLRRGGIK